MPIDNTIPQEDRPSSNVEDAELADRLEMAIGGIMSRWIEAVRSQLPAARDKNPLAIKNGLDDFFQSLLAALRNMDWHADGLQEIKVSRQHGQQRGNLSGYTLDQVLLEYRLLRREIFRTLRHSGEIPERETDIILDFIQDGMTQAGQEFTRAQEIDRATALNAERNYARKIAADLQLQTELQQTLTDTQEHLTLALKSARMGIWRINLKDNTVSATGEALDILGEIIENADFAETLRRRVHPDDYDKVKRVLEEAIRSGNPYAHDFRIVREDGQLRWILSRGTVKYSPNGEPLSMSGVLKDITDRKEADDKLAAEKHKFEAIFFNAPAAIMLFKGPEFFIEKANHGFVELFEGRELVGKTLREALPELIDQPFHDLLREVFQTGDAYTGREQLARLARHKGGELEDRYFDFTYARIDDAAGKPYGVVDHAIEVTDKVLYRKNIEESSQRLREAVERLEQERELRERFVSALSHDLRTPLAAAKVSAELLARATNDPAKTLKLAIRISESMDRADHMIRDLLDANRIRAGQALPLEIGECDLNGLVQATLEDLATVYGNRFVMRTAEPVQGYWDCSALRRIVENLAGNAVKYGAPGTPVTVLLCHENESQVALLVHNQGNPIPIEDQAKLFQPFQRTDAALHGRQKGWGIGLTLVQGLAEGHGGRADVESSPTKGTIFRVHLPLDARAFTPGNSHRH